MQLRATPRKLLGRRQATGSAPSSDLVSETAQGITFWSSRAVVPVSRELCRVIYSAHDDLTTIENTPQAGDAVGRRIPVLMDIAEPDLRVSKVKRQPGPRLVAGDRFRVVGDWRSAPRFHFRSRAFA
jgi:hypothetical protein